MGCRLTGFQLPTPVTSTGNVFSLRLTSDFAVSAHGFKLNYEELHSASCGNPGVPPKALLSGGGRFAVGDRVRYSCVPGYVLDGHATLSCITNAGNTAVWDFPAPICRGKAAYKSQSEDSSQEKDVLNYSSDVQCLTLNILCTPQGSRDKSDTLQQGLVKMKPTGR
ncbi:CUB and sushi domain-containing protein 3 [Liparis tanakae]|uniref:CUB and sushi domain-containing protein 3 n=1 Tax=Liparis tanakae TaxID=230148 RepID=A0A4Z2GKN4_9TELE|nr:CUB and sushi domain-containing protein 3 [Liparis tanakae]